MHLADCECEGPGHQSGYRCYTSREGAPFLVCLARSLDDGRSVLNYQEYTSLRSMLICNDFLIDTSSMLDEDSTMALYDEVLKIRQLLEMLSRGVLREELEKAATTEQRKQIWTLLNGARRTEDIAHMAGVSQRAVQAFVRDLERADLIITRRRGYPRRRFDYTPSDWNQELE